MASEISTSVNMQCSKNGASVQCTGSKTLDLTGTEMTSIVQSFGTADSQAVDMGGCDQAQVLAIKNLDLTATLTISLDTTHTQVISVIPPGGCILLYNTNIVLYGKSSAGTIDGFIVCAES